MSIAASERTPLRLIADIGGVVCKIVDNVFVTLPMKSTRGTFTRAVLRFVWLLPVLCLAACEETPTGRRQLALVPDAQLAAMGAETFAELKRSRPLETDRRINAYVRCVARAIIAALPEEQGSWEVAAFREPSPNAFALPGGKIGIHTGMLEVARTPAQLAAVIGHEVGHVLADHANERLTQELGVKAVLLLVDLFSEGQGSWTHEALMQALGLGAQVGVLLPFSRTHEQEADIIGLELMARAGFDPRQSLALWQNMARIGGAQPPGFLSTHPSHETRFERLEAQLDRALKMHEQALSAGRRPNCSAPSG